MKNFKIDIYLIIVTVISVLGSIILFVLFSGYSKEVVIDNLKKSSYKINNLEIDNVREMT